MTPKQAGVVPGKSAGKRKRGLAALERIATKKKTKSGHGAAQAASPAVPPAAASLVGLLGDKETGPAVASAPTPDAGPSASGPDGAYTTLHRRDLPANLCDMLLLGTSRRTTEGTDLEAFLIRLFQTSSHSFAYDVALAGKLHDKVLLLQQAKADGVRSAAAAVRWQNKNTRRLTAQTASTAALRDLSGGKSVVAALKASPPPYAALHKAMHEPWCTYTARLCTGRSKAEALKRLRECGWIGAVATVAACHDPRLTGVTGLVAWTSKSSVHLLTRTGRVKSVAWQGCVLTAPLSQPVVDAVGEAQLTHIGASMAASAGRHSMSAHGAS